MKSEFIGKTQSGIETYALENDNGMRAEIITYGARISRLFVPNKRGELIDVVAGFDTPDEYRDDHGTYFNAIIGRVGNRIGGSGFTLDKKEYKLYANDGANHLHGGKEGFDKKIWTAETGERASLMLSYLSADGEEGYPANLSVRVTYSLTNDNELKIAYDAQSDGTTLCSMTNHAYFNLDGDFKSALNHEIYIKSHAITAVDEELIPHGEILDIENTAFDFSVSKPLGRDINAEEKLLKIARGGYDFNYILDGDNSGAAASAYSKNSGIKMSVYTDRPCMQFYSGNFLDGFTGKKQYPYQSAFCMETQGYPNACNVKEFPSISLKAGEKYHTVTTYKFEICKE